MCIGTDLSISNSSFKEDFLSLQTVSRHLSYSFFNLLLTVLYLNGSIINGFIIIIIIIIIIKIVLPLM